MVTCKIPSPVFSLLVISMHITGNNADEEKETLRRKCRHQLQTCSLKNECFSNLTDDYRYLKSACRAMASPRLKKSAYIDEKLHFAPHISTRRKFPKNWTYSIFLGDNYYGDNLELVENCCNLREGDTCEMPATNNKTKTFFAVFPHKNTEDDIFCYHRVKYYDAPIDYCEEGKKNIDKCIHFENGPFKLKYRYTTLSHGTHETIIPTHNGCYFTLSSDMLPGITFQENVFQEVSKLVNVTITEHEELIQVSGNDTGRGCKHFSDVTQETYYAIRKKVYNPDEGNLVCFKVESFAEGYPFKYVLCEFVNIPSSFEAWSVEVWHVTVPMTSLVCLILLILTVKVCKRERSKRSKFIKEEDSVEIKPHASNPAEEVFEVLHLYEERKDDEISGETGCQHKNMSSRSTEESTVEDVSEISDGNDERDLLTGMNDIDENEDSAVKISENETTFEDLDSWNHTLPVDITKEDISSVGYTAKFIQNNVASYPPQSSTYLPKYIQKNDLYGQGSPPGIDCSHEQSFDA